MRAMPVKLVALAAVAFALSFAPEAGFGQSSPPVIPKPRPAITETKADSKPPKTTKAETAAKIDHGSVYLLRGLANIFSLGMNTLGEELEKRGVDTVVTNHSHGLTIVDKLAKQYETDKSILPIILIGHSLGGNKTLSMAEKFAEKNIPVRLVVIFDATRAPPVPLNVQEVLNLVKPGSVGVKVVGVPGYAGVIENQEVSGPGIGHISIDKSKQLHAVVIEKVLAVLSEDLAPKKKAPKKPAIEQPVAKIPETPPAETGTPEAKTPEVTATTPPETEAKTPEVTGTTPPATETKTPEVTEANAPKAVPAATPPVIPEVKPVETPATAAN